MGPGGGCTVPARVRDEDIVRLETPEERDNSLRADHSRIFRKVSLTALA